MTFELMKKNLMSKSDKSKIGSVDDAILDLVNLINSKDNYFTTSSCAGRIVLRSQPPNNQKNLCNWLFVSHDFIKVEDLNVDLPDSDVWFCMESCILHVCCRTVEDAIKLLNIAKPIGFKRSGITGIGNKIMVEIIATEHMEVIVAKDGNLLVSEDYLSVIVDEANKKLKQTRDKIDNLYKSIEK